MEKYDWKRSAATPVTFGKPLSKCDRCDTAASIVPSNVNEDAKGSQAAVERLMHSCFSERPSVGCFRCFVSLKETSELCAGYKMTMSHVMNMDRCFKTIDSIFNDNPKVIEAGRVGKAYKVQLQNIMKSQILPLVKQFRQTTNYDTVYESKLQTAADNFIAEASKLPRATGCIPPCGSQTADGHYDCVKCKKDSCNFPLDCPVENRTVEENNPVQMLCDVSFPLPQNTKIMKIWKFAEQVKTRHVELFEEVTVGEDNLYSISSTRTHHQGTYQCEIYSDEIAIARIYYYLTVTPHVVTGHSELQEIFERSLLPGGRLHAESPRPSQYLPSRVLIAICFTSLLLLLILSLGDQVAVAAAKAGKPRIPLSPASSSSSSVGVPKHF